MFFYGFVGVTAGRGNCSSLRLPGADAATGRSIPFAVLEKLSFGIGAMVLYRQDRLDHADLGFGGNRPGLWRSCFVCGVVEAGAGEGAGLDSNALGC